MLFTFIRNKYTDEKDLQLARILSVLFLVSSGAYIYVFGIGIFSHDLLLIAVTLLSFLIILIPAFLLIKGNLNASGFSFVLILLFSITGLATIGQGIQDTAMAAYPIIFVFAGLTMDKRLFKICVGIALLSIVWLIFGQEFGWYTPLPLDERYGDWTSFGTLFIILLVAALAVNMLATNMRANYDRVQNEILRRKIGETYREAGRNILQILNEEGNFKDALGQVLSELRGKTGFDAVAIRLQDGKDFPYFTQEGFSRELVNAENSLLKSPTQADDRRRANCGPGLECTCALVCGGKTDPANALFTKGGSAWTNDFTRVPDIPRNTCIFLHYASIALVPIRSKDSIVGLIQLCDKRKGFLTLETVEMLEDIASHIGSALIRKKMEEELRESEEIFDQFVSHSPIHIYIKDDELKLIKASNSFVELMGMPFEELRGRDPYDWAPREIAEEGREDELTILRTNSTKTKEMAINDRIFSMIQFPIHRERGKPNYLGGFVMDITETKRAEEALRNTQKLESLGLIAGGIAHNFNNVMAGTFGYIDMAMTETRDAKVLEYLTKASGMAEKGKEITAHLLTFAKGGSPRKEITELSFFVKETINVTLRRLQTTANFSIAENLWPCSIDRRQIAQTLDSVVTNAFEAMIDRDCIDISAVNSTLRDNEHPTLPGGNYVRISIRDYGIGIQKKNLSRIFDPFYTTKPRGQGLGLATSYSIVNRHGGAIDVDSTPGEGSTIHIYLPAANSAP